MSVTAYIGRMSGQAAIKAAGSFSARAMATRSQAEKLEAVDPLTPAAEDLCSMSWKGPDMDEIVHALDPHGSGQWWNRPLFFDLTTWVIQILARSMPAPTHREFLTIITAADYRPTEVSFGFYGAELGPVNENDVYPVNYPENGQSERLISQISDFGVIVPVQREEFIRDRKVGFLGRLTEALVGSAYRKEATLVYQALEANANLTDGQAWFDGSNTATGNSEAAALVAGFNVLAEQTLPNGGLLNARPAVLLIPAGWSIRADEMPIDFHTATRPITVMRSGAVSAAYLFADPSEFPSLGLLALNPEATPEVITEKRPKSGFGADVDLIVKIRHSMAVVPISRRGIVKMEISA